MNVWTLTTELLAELDQTEYLRALRQGFNNDASGTRLLGVLLGIATLCGFITLLLRIIRRRRAVSEAARVDYLALAGAARVVGLNRGELRDLRTVATRARFAHPTAMLLSPANLAFAARAARQVETDTGLWERLNRFSVKVFGVGLSDR
jgi:hypothetical protein